MKRFHDFIDKFDLVDKYQNKYPQYVVDLEAAQFWWCILATLTEIKLSELMQSSYAAQTSIL